MKNYRLSNGLLESAKICGNLCFGVASIGLVIILWLLLEQDGNLNLMPNFGDILGILGSSTILFIGYLIITHYFPPNIKKGIQYVVKYIPQKINTFHKQRLLGRIKHKENTFSLFSNFTEIQIDMISSSDNVLSLNGLVGKMNREEISTNVSDCQIKSFIEKIYQWRSQFDTINGRKYHLLDEEDVDNYNKIFTIDNIRHYIEEVNSEILKSDNTFNFIADQYGVFSAKYEKGSTLILSVYKTNYFTFRVMNKLYKDTPVLHKISQKICSSRNNKVLNEGFLLLFPFFASLGTNIIIEFVSANRGKGFLIQKRSPKSFGNTSQYHISVNETFSFTDIDETIPKLSKCIQRGIDEELGLDLSKEFSDKRITYLDLFLNPSRGNLGISAVYRTDINPSTITYYPGVDKVIESSKHICVYGIKNYFQMENFISLYNWIPYTPYLLKQYIIHQQGIIENLKTIWALDTRCKLIFTGVLLYRIAVIMMLLISIFYGIIINNSLASYICIPIIGYFEKKLWSKWKTYCKTRKLMSANKEFVSLGEFPYANALLYTGNRTLDAKDIVITLKTSVSLSASNVSSALNDKLVYDFTDALNGQFAKQGKASILLEKTEDVSWSNINIVSCKTGVRRVYCNSEYPTLILQGYQSSRHKGKSLYVREYGIESLCNKTRIYYIQKKDVIQFGYNHAFSSIFRIVGGAKIPLNDHLNKQSCYLGVSKSANVSSFAVQVLSKHGFNYFCHLEVSEEASGIDLFDIYQRQTSNEDSIIISAKKEHKTDCIFGNNYIEGSEVELSDAILKLKRNYIVDDQDILMLQQILIREDIKLFYKS